MSKYSRMRKIIRGYINDLLSMEQDLLVLEMKGIGTTLAPPPPPKSPRKNARRAVLEKAAPIERRKYKPRKPKADPKYVSPFLPGMPEDWDNIVALDVLHPGATFEKAE